MISKKQIEKEADVFFRTTGLDRMSFIVGCEFIIKELEKRRCDNCHNGTASVLDEGKYFCIKTHCKFEPDFKCGYWEKR